MITWFSQSNYLSQEPKQFSNQISKTSINHSFYIHLSKKFYMGPILWKIYVTTPVPIQKGKIPTGSQWWQKLNALPRSRDRHYLWGFQRRRPWCRWKTSTQREPCHRWTRGCNPDPDSNLQQTDLYITHVHSAAHSIFHYCDKYKT